MKGVDQEKAHQVALLLKQGFSDFMGKALSQGKRTPSQNEYAVWLSVPSTSLSNWMNEIRVPSGDNVDSIATRLGTRIYYILDIPPRMPRNKGLFVIAENWHKLTDQQQRRFVEDIKNLTFTDKGVRDTGDDDNGLAPTPEPV